MKLRISKVRAKLSIVLFCTIFAPPFIKNVNFIWLVFIYSMCKLVTQYRNEAKRILSLNPVRRFNVGFFTIALLISVHMLIDAWMINRLDSMVYIVQIYRFAGVIVIIQAVVIYIVCYCMEHSLNFNDLYECILSAGLIEAVFTILMLCSPQIKSSLVDIFINNVYGSIENSNLHSWDYNERLFGFANVLFDGFGYGTGIIAGMAFFNIFNKKNKMKATVVYIILAIVPLVNSVVGSLIVVIAVFLKGIQAVREQKIDRNSIQIVMFIAVLAVAIIGLLTYMAPDSINRLLNNLMAIMGISTKTEITSFSNLFRKSYWILPEGFLNLLFGTGHTVYSTVVFAHSDVGFINMIWLSGIIGAAFLYGCFALLLLRAFRQAKTSLEEIGVFYTLIVFFFFDIKGIGIALNTGIPIILLLAYMSLAVGGNQISV